MSKPPRDKNNDENTSVPPSSSASPRKSTMSTMEEEETSSNETDADDVGDNVVDYYFLIPQAIVGFIDSISLMIVLPSLVFYVQDAGGTQAQYGMICSAFALASFTCKPILGYWSDQLGHKFRVPYLASIVIASTGSFLYFLASAFAPSRTAIALIMVGRLLGGCGAANNALGYTYITQVIPQQHMTKAGAILSMIRVFGMTIAPGLNALLAKIYYNINILGITTFEINPLNVVGLVMMIGNLFGLGTIYLHLQEPPENNKQSQYEKIHNIPTESNSGGGGGIRSTLEFWKDCFRSDLLVPVLAYFTLNFNFQFMETGLAPAAHLTLGWETVAISIVFGIDSVLLFFVYVGTFQVSAHGVKDVTLMKAGLITSIIGYTLMYMWWREGVMMWMFVTPIIVCTAAFPFLGTPTRSIYAFVVSKNPSLCRHQGTMQALLSMTSSLAGFTAPYFVAGCVLRTPEQMDALENDTHVLNGLAFVAPLLSAITLFGLSTVQDELDYDNIKKTPSCDECEELDADCLTGIQEKENDPDCLTGLPIEHKNRDCIIGVEDLVDGSGERCPLLHHGDISTNDDEVEDTLRCDDRLSDSSDGDAGLSLHDSHGSHNTNTRPPASQADANNDSLLQGQQRSSPDCCV